MSHDLAVYCDASRRTCIRVSEDAKITKYIPLDVSNGLKVEEMPSKEFSRLYKEMADYPIERAAALYAKYAQDIGATDEALKYLSRVTKITAKENEMATAKKAKTEATKAASKVTKAKAPVASKGKAVAKATPDRRKPAVKVVVEKKVDKAPKEAQDKAPRESAASLFQELILAGKLTDDQIFSKVQEKFGLDDTKRSYVSWYRNSLKKKGMNPPEAKSGK